MELVQLNEYELEKLTKFEPEFQCMDGAIPPKHVLERSLDHYRDSTDNILVFPYFIKVNGEIVGSCGFKNPPGDNRVEIGYNIALGAQGKGIATSAVNRLCQIAFESQLVNVVFALISSENSASLNVARKNGFIYKNIVVDSEGEQLECWELTNIFNALENA